MDRVEVGKGSPPEHILRFWGGFKPYWGVQLVGLTNSLEDSLAENGGDEKKCQ